MELGERIQVCQRCFTYSERELCEICCDPKRDHSVVCVVEESRDIATIESTNTYHGLYHVLGGTLNPIEGMTPDVIRLKELLNRIAGEPDTQEIILALSPTIHGETTMMYLQKQLARYSRRVSRLARGLPVGATLEFADEVTLGDAMKGRHNM